MTKRSIASKFTKRTVRFNVGEHYVSLASGEMITGEEFRKRQEESRAAESLPQQDSAAEDEQGIASAVADPNPAGFPLDRCKLMQQGNPLRPTSLVLGLDQGEVLSESCYTLKL